MSRLRRFPVHLAAAGAVILALAGCSQAQPMPTPSPDRTTASAAPSPEPEATPEPVLDGTAQQNHDFFDLTNRALIDSGASLNGQAFIANLEQAGYPRAAMEVTPDSTTIGVAADNIVFSIRFGESCLLGQWGNIGYTSLVTDVTSTGRCLVGTAHPA